MPRCRRTRPILSSGTPCRSISVAAVCRRACAPLAGVTMAARFMRRFTTDEMPSPRRNGRHGAIVRRNTRSLRSAFEVGSDRIADLLRQRQPDLVARLAADPQRARLPLDIGEAKLRHVASPQPEARQQEQDRTVTSARTGVAVTG